MDRRQDHRTRRAHQVLAEQLIAVRRAHSRRAVARPRREAQVLGTQTLRHHATQAAVTTRAAAIALEVAVADTAQAVRAQAEVAREAEDRGESKE